MGDLRTGDEPDLKAFFSDTTEDYLMPPEPDLNQNVTIRLRTGKNDAQVCFLVVYGSHLRMHLVESDECFDYYEVKLEVTESPLRYYFMIIAGGKKYRYTRRGIRNTIRPGDWWHVIPGFHPPKWVAGAVMYQIFVDRFYNGDKSNDVVDGEYVYMGRPVVRMDNWNQNPSSIAYCEFYGGDLKGVIDKLDYLKDLGVEAIYLNPIFLSPSSHKYDTQDYEHIDPHFGKIVRDIKKETEEPEKYSGSFGRPSRFSNARAERYLERVTNPANLEASDKLFAKLVKKAHKRGIRVILDGVFNHCGSFHRWMDSEKIYEKQPGGVKGAMASKKSTYVDYFRFRYDDWPSNDSYDSWWDFGTLPKLDYEKSEQLCEYILGIARKWVSPPYCADGWRLDVASDLSYSQTFNHVFWKRFRQAVKEANPEAVIIAENYVDSWKWLQGDEWDTIMNYEFFMEPVTFFLTGMDKHSDARNEERYGDPEVFWRTALGASQEALPAAALQVSMNELSNHDHSRFLTRTNRVVGRLEDLGPAAAMEDVRMEIMRQAVLLQMTWTGAPTIYYGDEAGMGGFTDPDNRRTYPWGREDQGLIRVHKALAAFRKNSPALRRGSLIRLADEDGVLAYARSSRSGGRRETNIVLLNINHIKIEYETNVAYAGVPLEANLVCLFATGRGVCRARCSDSVFLESPAPGSSGRKKKTGTAEAGGSADRTETGITDLYADSNDFSRYPLRELLGKRRRSADGEEVQTQAGREPGEAEDAAAAADPQDRAAYSAALEAAAVDYITEMPASDSEEAAGELLPSAEEQAAWGEAAEAQAAEAEAAGAQAAEAETAEEETGFGEALEEEVSEWETPEAMDETDPAGSTGELLLSPEEEAAEEETGFGEGEALEEEAFGWKAAEEETAGWESSGEEAFGREASGEEAEGKSAGQSKESRPDEENRDYIPPVVTVHDGIMRITLPPESGILLRWSSLVSDPENK